MATVCDACGYRDNEVKSGSGIEEKGSEIKLKLTDPTDLSRDVLKVCIHSKQLKKGKEKKRKEKEKKKRKKSLTKVAQKILNNCFLSWLFA